MTAALRWLLWSLVLRAVAGLRVSGPRPTGACVVVANHSSHADTPALLAALGPGPVAVLAAADYWTGWRRHLCAALAAGVPVRRHGGGTQDLEPVRDLLARGYRVVVFPEGTRSPELGRFRSGAARLARDAGVPLVPAAIVGTDQLLPAHGRFRAVPIAVAFGDPTDDARPEVERLLLATHGSWPWARWRRWAASRWCLAALFLWALAEAVSWPVIAEVVLAAAALAAPRRAPQMRAPGGAGSVHGLLLAMQLDGRLTQPLVTPRMQAAVSDAYDDKDPFRATLHQAWSGIPGKAYAAEAGRRHAPVVPVVAGWVAGRGLRATLVVALAALLGRAAGAVPVTTSLLLSGFAVGWARVLTAWA
jgi:1-acyl-sn-glycerol-3-phosphate acyltransferase